MSTQLGDPLPDSLQGYYTDLDAGRIKEATLHFSDDVVFAIPAPGAVETDTRREFIGRDELLGWFEERGPKTYVHQIQLCVQHGTSCMLEGIGIEPSAGEPFATFAASAQLDDEGLVARYLAYMTAPAVDPPPSGDGPASGEIAEVLHRYFQALDAGAFADAADQFSADVVYSHPPYRHTGIDGNERVVFRGHDELLAAFTARGKQSFDHRIVAIRQYGPHCILEGVVEGLAAGGTGSFISSLTIDDDDRIQRYVSFYCEPGVARR